MQVLRLLYLSLIAERKEKQLRTDAKKFFKENYKLSCPKRKMYDEDDVSEVTLKQELDKDHLDQEDSMELYDTNGILDETIDELKSESREQLLTALYAYAKKKCKGYGMEIEREHNDFYITTSAGKWRFCPLSSNEKTRLYHKNYDYQRRSPGMYHLQYEREESIDMTMKYIYKHDKKRERMIREKKNNLFSRSL